jgi:pimeloyl-ACP methyl ester carboxylesterase
MGLVALLALGALLVATASVAVIVHDARHPARASVGWALARRLPTNPSEAGMEAIEGSVPCDDGTALPMWTVRGGNPSGPSLLLLHGWRRSRIDSLRRLPWLLPHVREAVVMDLRGHGDAPRGPATLGPADIRDACAALRTATGVPWIVAGHSLGAAVAMRAAAEACRSGIRVQGVLLVCPYPHIAVPLSGRLSSMGMPAFPLAQCAARVLSLACGREPSARNALGVLGASAVPTVWVACASDAIVPASEVERLHAQATSLGSPALLCTDSDADHDSAGTGHPAWAPDAIRALTQPTAAATTH